jgi:hypothetical protein
MPEMVVRTGQGRVRRSEGNGGADQQEDAARRLDVHESSEWTLEPLDRPVR